MRIKESQLGQPTWYQMTLKEHPSLEARNMASGVANRIDESQLRLALTLRPPTRCQRTVEKNPKLKRMMAQDSSILAINHKGIYHLSLQSMDLKERELSNESGRVFNHTKCEEERVQDEFKSEKTKYSHQESVIVSFLENIKQSTFYKMYLENKSEKIIAISADGEDSPGYFIESEDEQIPDSIVTNIGSFLKEEKDPNIGKHDISEGITAYRFSKDYWIFIKR